MYLYVLKVELPPWKIYWLGRQNHQNLTARREIEQRSAGEYDYSNVKYGTKMKAPTTIAKVNNCRILCAIGGVYRHSVRFLDRVSTKVSVRMSTDNRSADIWPTLNGYSLSADSWSMFGRNIAVLSPTKHRHTTEVSSTLVLHVVDTSVDCHFWMFKGLLLSKCHLEVSTWF